MRDPALPPNLAAELVDLRRRISELERRNPLARASAHDGTNTRVEIGNITHPYSNPANQDDFGIIIRDDGGVPVFMVDSGGALIPGNPGFISDKNEQNSHTSSSWTDDEFITYFVGSTGEVMSMAVQYRCGTGITSAEMRLSSYFVNSPGSDATTEAYSLTCDNAYHTDILHWNAGVPVNPNDVWAVESETRITGGAGTIDVRRPRWAMLRSAVAVDTNIDTA